MPDNDDPPTGRMLPEPTLTLTLPSIHDGTVLDCRVFHPYSLSPSPRAPPWQRHAAVIAHPYAPLGGCYDDPVVDVVAATLLRLGFLVATFNFRGASGSAGRTSWTAKAERADYVSVVGFVSHYAHHLDPFRQGPAASSDAEHPDKPPPPPPPPPSTAPLLLLAGYSYGAMVTAQLPGLATMHAPFSTPATGSPAAEIRHRAEHLAAAQNAALGEARTALQVSKGNGSATASPRKSLGVRVGGDEDIRRSHESGGGRRSLSLEVEERFRRGVAKARRGGRHGKGGGGEEQQRPAAAGEADDRLPAPVDPPRYRAAYLLVSPLQGVVTNLATMSFPNPFLRRRKSSKKGKPTALPRADDDDNAQDASGDGDGDPVSAEGEQKLVRNPTLAVYGDQDVFVSARKLREWARRLEGAAGSRFRAHEVSTAGHFWTEERVLYVMRNAMTTFAEGLLAG
ncbi:Alpha/Beta hydrolase protein [Phialemonium atrogriseum]|uniref:Alpha/Beta hydrolase protein n=1 Tax=Phialemonium atrogriseum TaxID=1093897 RepID=A0AAJ0BVT0_9PEZI|nr:Alpha/Beta hydrolase protein [Phialemonium atrogriseum]KAK1762996.1 Alpha/Beta hydrolase protein [Phialemonium atrogriseum]